MPEWVFGFNKLRCLHTVNHPVDKLCYLRCKAKTVLFQVNNNLSLEMVVMRERMWGFTAGVYCYYYKNYPRFERA